MAKKMNDSEDTILEEAAVSASEIPIAQPPQASARPARLIYVGPNVPGGILQRFQVFKGGLPPHCKDLFEKVPAIKELFVPVEGLEAMRQKIEESGTNEARLFYVVSQKLTKGVK
jgi:hypothetical protein